MRCELKDNIQEHLKLCKIGADWKLEEKSDRRNGIILHINKKYTLGKIWSYVKWKKKFRHVVMGTFFDVEAVWILKVVKISNERAKWITIIINLLIAVGWRKKNPPYQLPNWETRNLLPMRAHTVRSTELEIYCSDFTVIIMIAVGI